MTDITFPSTETFLINWLGGTCGAFITMLVYNILFPKDNVEISPSKNGNAHTNQQIISTLLYRYNKNFVDGDYTHPYKTIDPRYPDSPLVLFDHAIPNLDIFFNKFATGKIIIIRLDEKMIPLLHGNVFYKTTMEFDYSKKQNIYWELLRKQFPYLEKYESPHDVPTELIKQMFLYMINTYNIEDYYSEQYIAPKEYSNRIYFIDFYDIIFNKSKVLSQLSEITNKPITDFVDNQYDIYLEKQHELINTKLSWIDLSLG